MDTPKQYVVKMGAEVMFGPETDYSKVKNFMGSLSPAVKGKCAVHAVAGKVVAAATPAATTATTAAKPAAAKPTPAAAHKPAAATVSIPEASTEANTAFNSYLEGGGPTGFWKPKDGQNLIRILPVGGVLPTDWITPYPFIISGVHPKVGLSLNETIYCARQTHGKACPICQWCWKLYNSADANDKKLSKDTRSYKRIIANIIDLANIEGGVQKFAFGKTLAGKIISLMEDPEYKPLLDPESGHNFIIIKKTVGGFPNYDESRPQVKRSALSESYPKWREECHDLKKEIVEKSYDELMAILTDTKKAILSTDSSEYAGDMPAAMHQTDEVVDPAREIMEMESEEIKDRLNSI